MRRVLAMAALAVALSAGVAGADVASSQPQDARSAFLEARKAAELAQTGATGLLLWRQFLREFPDGPFTQPAQRELEIWQKRADQNLVRFGPDWLAEKEAADRAARADELIRRSQATDRPAEAMALLNEAARIHPYRIDIPFAVAELCYRARQARGFGLAMGEALKIDPNHPAALNNIGIAAVDSKNWTAALTYLSRAAEGGRCEAALDNLEQVIALAEADNYSGPALAAAKARAAACVAAAHAAGRHSDEERWGGQWITRKEYDTRLAVNKLLDGKIEDLKGRLDKLESAYRKAKSTVDAFDENRRRLQKQMDERGRSERYRSDIQKKIDELQNERDAARQRMPQLEEAARKLRAEMDDLAADKHVPVYPGLVRLLKADGVSEIAAIDVADPRQKAEQERRARQREERRRRQEQDGPPPQTQPDEQN